MIEILLILIVSFMAMLLLNIPIAITIAMSSFLAILAAGLDPSYQVAFDIADGVGRLGLLPIPFFILSGIMMGRGGIASRLIDLAKAFIGWFPGGLALVNTLTCMIFGALSGSAVAAVSSIGGFMIPEMNKEGYDRDFNVAVTSTAATTGLLIPPSNIMIIYAVASGVTVEAMFMAGIIPGLLVGICIMTVCVVVALKRGHKAGEFVGISAIIKSFRRAFLSLLLIFIVIGGILGGIFTATEASAVAVAYSFILAVFVYKKIQFKDLPEIFLQSGKTTSIVMLMIGASSAMSTILTLENIPQMISQFLMQISDNPIIILLIINVTLLMVGTFMDMTPALLIFTPIFLPVVNSDLIGMHPVHFGIMMIANLCIGLCTPPVGSCLFVGCGVGNTTISKASKPMLPFFLAMLIALLLTSYIPAISMFLPELLGLTK
ncbi:MAG: TRAP transporter large permease [Bacteroidetes bacterium]|jgi:tripartite ATP-independent transporter DctM subunit|nr:TRAP transporter large permease [Bacteroidota bacterium]